jgi:hypothetical protein
VYWRVWVYLTCYGNRQFSIGQNQNREPFIVQFIGKVPIFVIPAKAGIQFFWIPGHARNDKQGKGNSESPR